MEAIKAMLMMMTMIPQRSKLRVPGRRRYFLAETVKYLYLLFDESPHTKDFRLLAAWRMRSIGCVTVSNGLAPSLGHTSRAWRLTVAWSTGTRPSTSSTPVLVLSLIHI